MKHKFSQTNQYKDWPKLIDSEEFVKIFVSDRFTEEFETSDTFVCRISPCEMLYQILTRKITPNDRYRRFQTEELGKSIMNSSIWQCICGSQLPVFSENMVPKFTVSSGKGIFGNGFFRGFGIGK